ncbi:unnamed protein product [Ectocarpus sp. CCAP 1310/34]|nr:unnamed protein product [Ectocarpus sp. CCAP 1310/34]
MRKKKHAEDQLDLDGHPGTSAFPDSPGGGNTLRGAVLTHGNRDRGRSGHFPIPRFDSIRGRFDSGIFASNVAGGGGGGAVAGAHVGGGGPSGELEKISAEQANVSTTAQSTPSGANGSGVGTGGGGRKAGNAPRSTVLDGRLVAKGYTTTDMGRPTSSSASRAATAAVGEGSNGGGGARGEGGWGLAMSGEYPDLEGTDPYAINNAMAETGTATTAGGRDVE